MCVFPYTKEIFKSRSVPDDFTNMFMKKHNELPHKFRKAVNIFFSFLLSWQTLVTEQL